MGADHLTGSNGTSGRSAAGGRVWKGTRRGWAAAWPAA